MRPYHLIVVAGVLLIAAGRGPAQPPFGLPAGPAGPPAANTRPAFSPYLNLARGDASPGVNYYGLVRPQLTTMQSLTSLQQQLAAVQPGEVPPGMVDPSLPVTGQPVYFLNTGGYFLNQRVGPGLASPGASRLTTGPFAPPRPTPSPSRTR